MDMNDANPTLNTHKLFVALALGAWIFGSVASLAQAPDAASAAKFRQSAQFTQSRLAVESLTEEILAIDGEIERRVNKLVSMLVAVTDSKESGRKIANQKEELMEGLKRSIDWYCRERAKRQSSLSAGYRRIPVADLVKGVSILDEKVEKRIEQILELSASLSGHKDVAKYELSYDEWDDEWDRRVSDEWRHTQRVSAKTDRAQDKIRQGLENDARTLDRERTDLERALRTTRNPETRKHSRGFPQMRMGRYRPPPLCRCGTGTPDNRG